MKTSQRPIFQDGGDASACSPQASPASPSAWPDSERERATTATSGRRLSGQFTKSGPLGSLARTLLASSRWYSPDRSLRWEAAPLFSRRVEYTERSGSTSSRPSARTLSARDIPSSRLLFRLVPSVRHTAGTGYGLLPSVQTQGLKRCNEKGSMEFFPLELPPTPTVMEDRRKPNGDSKRQEKLMSNLNPYSIQKLLPTPTSIDGGSGRVNRSVSKNAKDRPTIALAAKMGLLPTPTVSCQKEGCPKERKDGTPSTSELNHLFASRTGAVSQLNPLFVSDMMGFPIMWCDI